MSNSLPSQLLASCLRASPMLSRKTDTLCPQTGYRSLSSNLVHQTAIKSGQQRWARLNERTKNMACEEVWSS